MENVNLTTNVSNNLSQDFISRLFSFLDLSHFSEKDQLIINFRLKFFTNESNTKKYTLQELADLDAFKVTRERIRQLEKRLLKQLRIKIISFLNQNFKLFEDFVYKINVELDRVKIVTWPKEVFALYELDCRDKPYSKFFIQFIISEFVLKRKYIESLSIDDTQYIITSKIGDIKILLSVIKRVLKDFNNIDLPVVHERQILSFPISSSFDQKIIFRKIIEDKTIYAYSSNGGYIRTSLGLKEIVYKILDENNIPLHYKEIFDQAKIKFPERTFYIKSLHGALSYSELIHPSKGQGMYALKKWGLKDFSIDRFNGEMSIDSLMEGYLKQNGPQEYENIRNYVLLHRRASENTMRQGLGRLGCFQNRDKKYYWFSEKVTLEKLLKNLFIDNVHLSLDEITDILKEYNYSRSTIYVRILQMNFKLDEKGRYFLKTYD